jgi:hypothetical protein
LAVQIWRHKITGHLAREHPGIARKLRHIRFGLIGRSQLCFFDRKFIRQRLGLGGLALGVGLLLRVVGFFLVVGSFLFLVGFEDDVVDGPALALGPAARTPPTSPPIEDLSSNEGGAD